MDEWMKMIEDGQREDEIRNNWQKRIDGGLKGIKRFHANLFKNIQSRETILI